MTNTFIGRQAIYDKQSNVFAYEILSNGITENNTQQDSTIIRPHELSEINLPELIGEHPALIKITPDFLTTDRKIPDLQNQLILEISADIEITNELITTIKHLSDNGYMVALDNFIYHKKIQPLIEIANIIKINILQLDVQTLRNQLEKLKNFDALLLAKKIETQEEFELCKKHGFDYFQGSFICQPKTVGNQRTPSNRITIVNLLTQLQDPGVQLDKLEELITQDLALSYRLLKYINSAAFALQREVESIHDAIIILGLNTIRSLANLMLMSNIDDKPQDLFALAIIRARMSETLGANVDKQMKETFFTAGLFSVIDALMDDSMNNVLEQLPLAPVLNEALLNYEGIVGAALKCCIAFERADWENVQFSELEQSIIQKAYFDAVIWSNEAMASLMK